jgi:ketosteroid isomerase-like protein
VVWRETILVFFLLLAPLGSAGRAGQASAKDEIEAFNRKFVELHLKMDHAGVLAMWADDGVDLMPGMAPLIGKPAIAAWLKGLEPQLAGSKVTTEDLQFHDIHVSGDWASEWAEEHQAVEREGKPRFEGYGKLALVLHREEGQWKIKQEMWNSSPRP